MNDLKLVMKLEKIFFDYMYINVNTKKFDENENECKEGIFHTHQQLNFMHKNECKEVHVYSMHISTLTITK